MDSDVPQKGITMHPISPRTLAMLRDPSHNYDPGPPTDNQPTPQQDDMSPEERQAFNERQAELLRTINDPSLGFDLRLGHDGTEAETWSDDIRMYTRAMSGTIKFWGVRDEDETIDEFWARSDPEDTRHQEPTEGAGSPGLRAQIESTQEARSPREKTPVPRRRSKQASQASGSHKVKKPAATSSPVNRNTRKSLGSRKEIEHRVKSDQAREGATEILSSDRPTRRQQAARAPKRQEVSAGQDTSNSKATPPKPAKTSQARARTRKAAPITPLPEGPSKNVQAVDEITLQKHRRGQAPAKAKPTPRKKTDTKQQTPVVRGNAKITKRKKASQPSAAPSVHTMRTRARGSAEKIGIA